MSEENELPRGWISAKCSDICTIIMGQSPPSSEYNEKGEGLPFFQGKAEFTGLFPDVRKWCTAPTKIAEENDILLSIRAPVGPTNLAPSRCSIGRGLAAIRPEDDIQVRYVLYAIRTFNSYLVQLATGTTFEAVSGDDVRAFEIPLAPIPEQHRIIAAIEQQFSRLDAAVAALRRAQAKLKRYRAAVLKAAVEGKLTEAWRAEHPTTEPASNLLERILTERRAKWEADLRAKGKDPAKVKYVEPAKPDVESLPEGWCWATVEQVCERVTDCLHSTPVFKESGFVCIDTNCIKPSRIVYEKVRYVDEATFAERNRRMKPEENDVLFSREGALLGVAVSVPANLEFCLGQRMMIFRLNSCIEAKYYENVLNSSIFRSQYASEITGTASPHLNIRDICRFAIPLPPLAEQQAIIADVERCLSVVGELDSTVTANLKRAERLRQSILKEAFAGRLVPQDPSDEPANILLERIRKERDQRKNGAVNKGRVVSVAEPVKIDVRETKQVELWEGVGG